MARPRLVWCGLIAVCACRSTPPAADADAQKVDRPKVALAPDAGPPDTGVPDAGVVEVLMPLEQYRATYMRDLMRLTKSREAIIPEADLVQDDRAPIPHSVAVLKKIGQAESYVVASVGFGRVAHGGKRRANVELLAYVEQYGPKVAQVIEALGEAMHSRGENAPAWKEYDTVQLPSPKHGMEYFDLRPAGEIDVSSELRVTLLKVVPMSHEEFQKSQNNPSGDWDDPNANVRAYQRWRRLLER